MITAAVLDAMLASGCTADQIVAAVKASLSDHAATRDERDDRRRELAKARQQRRRDKLKAAPVTRDVTPAPRARVEDKPLTTVQEPQLLFEEKKAEKPSGRDAAEFRAAFPDLDPERLEALIKLRKAKRAPLSAYAAKLFRADLEKCGLSITAGADLVISRNWLTVKPEWLQGRQQQGPPGTRRMSKAEQTGEDLAREIYDLQQRTGSGGEASGDLRLAAPVSSTGGKAG